MRERVNGTAIALMLAVGAIAGCSGSTTPPTTEVMETAEVAEVGDGAIDVTVSILPQKYFVEKIGGENVNVNVMVPPGASPATYEPKPQQLKDLSDAEAYVSIGIHFEKPWMPRMESANPQMAIVDSAAGIEKLPLEDHHHHEGEEVHDHGGDTLDPHIWLSPRRAKQQAQNIYEGLVKVDPENQETYRQNLEQFLAEIDQIDAQIRANLEGVGNRKFMVFHPSWGYFADDYNLEQKAIEVGGQEPSASELAALIAEAKAENIRVIFAQPEFNTQSVQTIAQEIGGDVILVTPLAPNWSENLLEVSEKFAEALN
ncbi:MAG: metal ABC transporter solute-binding protein, Zn/Mn family [Limnospira sp.]